MRCRQGDDGREGAVGLVAVDGAAPPDRHPEPALGVDGHAVGGSAVRDPGELHHVQRVAVGVEGAPVDDARGAVGDVEQSAVGAEGGAVDDGQSGEDAVDGAVVVGAVERTRARGLVVRHAAGPEAALRVADAVVHPHGDRGVLLRAGQPLGGAVRAEEGDAGARRGDPGPGAALDRCHRSQRHVQAEEFARCAGRGAGDLQEPAGEDVGEDQPAVHPPGALPQLVGAGGPDDGLLVLVGHGGGSVLRGPVGSGVPSTPGFSPGVRHGLTVVRVTGAEKIRTGPGPGRIPAHHPPSALPGPQPAVHAPTAVRSSPDSSVSATGSCPYILAAAANLRRGHRYGPARAAVRLPAPAPTVRRAGPLRSPGRADGA